MQRLGDTYTDGRPFIIKTNEVKTMLIIKKILKIVLSLLLVLLLVVGGYVAYVFIAYHRLGDMELEPTKLDAAPISVSKLWKEGRQCKKMASDLACSMICMVTL